MNYILNTSSLSDFFTLPNIIVDEYINKVEFNYIKVILFIYRNKTQNLSLDEIAQKLEMSKETLNDYIEFWILNKILPSDVKLQTNKEVTDEIDKIHDVQQIYLDKFEKMVSKALKLHENANNNFQNLDCKSNVIKSSFSDTSKEYIPSKSDDIKLDDTELYNFMEHIQYILARPITYTEKNIFCDIIDLTKLPIEVILMAVEYCVTINKTNIKYIKKVCEDWDQREINTHELAENYLMELKRSFSIESKIKTHFGINNRNLSSKEKQFLNKWVNVFKFKLDLIILSYDKTIDTIGELSFPYMNSILESWNKNNIKSVDQANDLINKSTKRNFNKSIIKNNSKSKDTSYELGTFDLLFENVPEF